MTITAVDIKRVFFDTKGKESFTVEYNQITDEITLTVDGIERNKFKSQDAEKKYEDLLNYIKNEFIKFRDVVKN
jgi:hypothetical protein|tara:strand:- start:538 stop:759 length:222 start_codon:yes stop_codon:yes gene_type:complete